MTNPPRRLIKRPTSSSGQKIAGRPQNVSSGPIVLASDLWPLDAPGIPEVCGNLLNMAYAYVVNRDDPTEELRRITRKILHTLIYGPEDSGDTLQYRYELRGYRQQLRPVVPGHLWTPTDRNGNSRRPGPCRADVMVIGKMLGEVEERTGRHFSGPSGQFLLDTLRQLGIRGMSDWYMTNLLKTVHPEGTNRSSLSVGIIKEWLPVLHQELRIVQPKFILCVGADAAKALLGRNATIKHMEGQVISYDVELARHIDEKRAPFTALVMAVTHPAQVLAAPETKHKFVNQLARFGMLLRGERWDLEERGLEHRVVRILDDVRDLIAEINADIEQNLLAFDAEWHGQHPQNDGSYLRTIQLSWKFKTAAAIVLRDEFGEPLYSDDELAEVVELLNQLAIGKRLAAHFGDADLEWLEYYGIHWRQYYHNVPAEHEGGYLKYARDWISRKPGGFDTGLAAHALMETDDFSLTSQVLQHTAAPRYDVGLLQWKKDYCRHNKLKAEELEGYGPCPDAILLGEPDPKKPGHYRNSYACYDADVVWRLVRDQQRRLFCDSYGNNCWEAFWMGMRAQPAVLEINCTGVLVDRQRIDELTVLYLQARDALQEQIREWANWPTLNINSVFQIREFLFGEQYNGKERERAGGPPVRLRPPDARSLELQPILTTDKRPMPWEQVIAQKLESEKTPSTNKTSLELLRQAAFDVTKYVDGELVRVDFSDQVMWLRDYRFISQVLKSSLRPPLLEDSTDDNEPEVYRTDKDGFYVYGGGLAAAICTDNRVRTHIYPTKETGRWSSARPPLHNWSKRREVDYERILGDKYSWPLRSVIKSSPGRVFVEADYIGAELFGMAIMAGDPAMIEHAKRNQLPEDDPNFYDIHSNVAKLAFSLNCEPTKAGLKSIGKAHLRICAKAVIFGIAYGRQAKAIALQCREEGVSITVDEAQNIINTVFRMYPYLVPFFNECQRRAIDERWLKGCFGRYRRFPVTFEQATKGDFERQAMNFPIQGMIADAVARAVDYLYVYRQNFRPDELDYRIVLQIHDALLLEVPDQHVSRVVEEVLPFCMCQAVPIIPTRLDGTPSTEEEYRLGIDVQLFHHWGVKMNPGEYLARKISPELGGFVHGPRGWHKPGAETKVWQAGGWVNIAS